jgi:diguanylate cyclase (GGDEF)-like protein
MSDDREGPPAALSIRARLMVLAAIVLVPLLLDRIRSIEINRAERINAAGQQTLGLVHQGVDAHREIASSARAFLQAAARVYPVVATAESCDRVLADLTVSWIKALSLADRDGRIVCSSSPQAVGLDVSDRLYFQRARQTGGYVVSDYTLGRLSDRPTLVAGFPQRGADGAVEAVLIGVLDSVWIDRLTKATAGRSRAAVLMLDRDGAILAHDPASGHSDSRAFKDHPLARAMLARAEGVVTADGLDGVRRVFGFVQLPGTETRLAIGLDADEILARVDREMRYAYLQLAAIGGILLLAIWFGGNRLIVRPIRLLAHMAERFGRGEYETRSGRRRWAAEFTPLVSALDEMAAKMAERRDQARVATEHLSALAARDDLSGLANRRAFYRRLQTEWRSASTQRSPLALLMIDADHFKAFNDHYGHLGGDACLRALGEVLAVSVRPGLDLAARYGGEEFAVLMPGTDRTAAIDAAERLRKAVEARRLQHPKAPLGFLTVSIGVAAFHPAPGERAQVLLEAADAALYVAKRRGRNMVVADEPTPLPLAS